MPFAGFKDWDACKASGKSDELCGYLKNKHEETHGKETVAIPSSLSSVSVGAKKRTREINKIAGKLSTREMVEEIAEGGPGSGRKPEGGSKDEEPKQPPPYSQPYDDPEDTGDAAQVANEYLSWLDKNDMLDDAEGAYNYLTYNLGMDPSYARDALKKWGADPSLIP